MFELVHFRGADKIIKEKKMANGVKQLMEYLHDCLFGTRYKGELMRQALTEMDWRQNGDTENSGRTQILLQRFQKPCCHGRELFQSMNIYRMLC